MTKELETKLIKYIDDNMAILKIYIQEGETEGVVEVKANLLRATRILSGSENIVLDLFRFIDENY